ncbi:MAG: ABC transporter ATP-binding protein [Candidatus Heimdallarchaeota archaeon]
MTKPLLKVQDLRTSFYLREGELKAVDRVNFSIDPGEILGLVGESGCGKSVTALSILRLIPDPPGRIVGGKIFFKGDNLLEKTEKEMRAIRGNQISMIFQDPTSSLNPVFQVGNQVDEVLEIHQAQTFSEEEIFVKTVEMLQLVGIPQAESRRGEYPHEFSGGMQQRVMTAMALACEGDLLIADEPTTALDVTIQAQIIDLMLKLRKELGLAILLITHNMGLIAEMCDKVAVMYAGSIVETAQILDIFDSPQHPYTKALLNCLPRLDVDLNRLEIIKGRVPNPIDLPKACKFAPRCSHAMDVCRREIPTQMQVSPDHTVSCFLYSK